MEIELEKPTEKITCKMVVIAWLKEQTSGTIIAHHVIDQSLPEYGKEMNAYYSPATFHRNFCWLKKEPDTLQKNGIELEQLVEGSGKVNKWRVVQKEQFKLAL